jgi:hypothetical protein
MEDRSRGAPPAAAPQRQRQQQQLRHNYNYNNDSNNSHTQEATINLHFDDEATTLSSKVRLAGSKEGRFEDGGIHAHIAQEPCNRSKERAVAELAIPESETAAIRGTVKAGKQRGNTASKGIAGNLLEATRERRP